MGLIKESSEVDFTVIPEEWSEKDKTEFSELIKKQKESRKKRLLQKSKKDSTITE